MITDKEIYF